MTLRFYNTLSRDTEIFAPINPRNVRLYVCGPTVYDFAHIGNARPVIVFDVLFRLLRHVYGAEHVTYVRNITDVDDKINARAAEEGVAIRDLTERTAEQFFKDAVDLGTLSPTVQPRATEHIPEMIALIERLVAGGHAYAAEGHVLFGVPSMAEYGRLSRRGADDIRAGARVEVAPYKRDEQDFVLWKPSKSGEPAWESPWGAGRPGWHLECSAMAWKHLGEVFDLHGGGIDLVFPHHENEIAQSRCAFDTSLMAKVWMHNGFLQVEGEKMAKSLGNFVTIRDLLNDWPGDVLRLTMLSTQYRQPINWTVKGLETATRTLEGWFDDATDKDGQPVPAVLDALMDDLNTPQAIAEIHAARGDGPALAATLDFFGFRRESVEERRRSRRAALAGDVERLIAARTEARKSRNFTEADRIRDEISALGVTLKDSPQGTTWEVS